MERDVGGNVNGQGSRVSERPIVTVDAVILTLEDDRLKTLVHLRPQEPFQGVPALPGGYVHTEEDMDTAGAMRRILEQKVGIRDCFLEQIATFSGQHRDPRGWSLSVGYLALVPRAHLDSSGPSVRLVDAAAPGALAFDHDVILFRALRRLRDKGAYSTLPAMLLDETFTLVELQSVYEKVLGCDLDKSSFRRKLIEMRLIEETADSRRPASRRPSRLWRLAGPARTFDRTLGQASA